MQKKIIALAVAGLASTAAFAQTNVTIYGVADAAFVYTNTNGGNTANTANQNGRDKFAIENGGLAGSRIGFKGTEDLGNGLKAVFVLEYALAIDANSGIGNTGGLNSRQSYVGLSTKAGDVTLGRQYAPGYYTLAMDALAASPALSVVDAAQAAAGTSIRGTSPSRWNNSVNYKTANMGGFSAQAIYAMGEYNNEIAMGESYGIGLDYAAGPVAVKYVYQNASGNMGGTLAIGTPTGTTPATNNGATQEHYVGASYDLKVVKLMTSAQIMDKGNRTNAGGQAAEGAVYQFGAVVPVGKGKIHASYAYADLNSASRQGPGTYVGEYQGVSVAYTHGLSKRTTLYTGLRYQDMDSKANSAHAGAGAITTVFGAGINHTF